MQVVALPGEGPLNPIHFSKGNGRPAVGAPRELCEWGSLTPRDGMNSMVNGVNFTVKGLLSCEGPRAPRGWGEALAAPGYNQAQKSMEVLCSWGGGAAVAHVSIGLSTSVVVGDVSGSCCRQQGDSLCRDAVACGADVACPLSWLLLRRHDKNGAWHGTAVKALVPLPFLGRRHFGTSTSKRLAARAAIPGARQHLYRIGSAISLIGCRWKGQLRAQTLF